MGCSAGVRRGVQAYCTCVWGRLRAQGGRQGPRAGCRLPPGRPRPAPLTLQRLDDKLLGSWRLGLAVASGYRHLGRERAELCKSDLELQGRPQTSDSGSDVHQSNRCGRAALREAECAVLPLLRCSGPLGWARGALRVRNDQQATREWPGAGAGPATRPRAGTHTLGGARVHCAPVQLRCTRSAAAAARRAGGTCRRKHAPSQAPAAARRRRGMPGAVAAGGARASLTRRSNEFDQRCS